MTTSISSETTYMYAEAAYASTAVRHCLSNNLELFATIGSDLRKNPPKFVVTNSRGSSDHAGVFAKYLIMHYLGTFVASGAPSLISVYDRKLDASSALVLSISQSGTSPDIVANAAVIQQSGGASLSILNQDQSALSLNSHYIVPMFAGLEQSIAATKSVISSLAAVMAIVAHWSENEILKKELDQLPDLLCAAWELDWTLLIEGLEGVGNLYTIGRGACLGISNEAALKFKETCQIHAESFSAAECMHGPLALLGPSFPLLAFCPDDAGRESVHEVAEKAISLGAKVFLVGSGVSGAVNLPVVKAPVSLQPILMLQSFYKAVSEIAVRRGLNPDRPPLLNKVTETR